MLRLSDDGRAHPQINFAFSTAAAKWLWLRKHRPEKRWRAATRGCR